MVLRVVEPDPLVDVHPRRCLAVDRGPAPQTEGWDRARGPTTSEPWARYLSLPTTTTGRKVERSRRYFLCSISDPCRLYGARGPCPVPECDRGRLGGRERGGRSTGRSRCPGDLRQLVDVSRNSVVSGFKLTSLLCVTASSTLDRPGGPDPVDPSVESPCRYSSSTPAGGRSREYFVRRVGGHGRGGVDGRLEGRSHKRLHGHGASGLVSLYN